MRTMKRIMLAIAGVAFIGLVFILACAPQDSSEAAFLAAASSTEFANPEPVVIRGYNLPSAQDPFISADGQYLFFDDRSDKNHEPTLHWARRIDYKTFAYQGKIEGVNIGKTNIAPSMDRDGYFYFSTDRSYRENSTTVYRGAFSAGRVSGAAPVGGASHPGWAQMDVEVTPDGKTLYLSDFKVGLFGPSVANLRVATKNADGSFTIQPNSDDIFRSINNGGLNFAPDTRDGLELFFTHAKRSDGTLRIYVANRNSTAEPFGVPALVSAAEGQVEATSLSSDGVHLYYHKISSPRETTLYVLTRQARGGRPAARRPL
jgi:hypothetical protein